MTTTTRTFDLHVTHDSLGNENYFCKTYRPGTTELLDVLIISAASYFRLIWMFWHTPESKRSQCLTPESKVLGTGLRFTFTVDEKPERFTFEPGCEYMIIKMGGNLPVKVQAQANGTFIVTSSTPWERDANTVTGTQALDEVVRYEVDQKVHANNAQRQTMEAYDSAYSLRGPHSAGLADGQPGSGDVVYTLWFHNEPHAIEWHINPDGYTYLIVSYFMDYKLVQHTGKRPVKQYYAE